MSAHTSHFLPAFDPQMSSQQRGSQRPHVGVRGSGPVDGSAGQRAGLTTAPQILDSPVRSPRAIEPEAHWAAAIEAATD